jgi:hypothetical protein
MAALHPQFIVNQTGEKVSVILPIAEYQKLLEEADDQSDIKQYLAAKKEPLEFLDAETSFEALDKKRAGK